MADNASVSEDPPDFMPDSGRLSYRHDAPSRLLHGNFVGSLWCMAPSSHIA